MLTPTDTIRGLSCDATSEEAVEKIYEIKQRPKEKSMIVLMENEEMLAAYGVALTQEQRTFLTSASKPTTIIFPGIQGLAPSAYYTDGTVGIRIVKPDSNHPGSLFIHSLLQAFGKPLVSTSANLSGQPSPLLPTEISADIIDSVDYPVPFSVSDLPGQPSQIIRFASGDVIDIIRA